MSRYSFLGVPMPDGMAQQFADRLTVRDERDGTYIVRARTARYVALRCRCGHHERQHGVDRRGRAMCFGSTTCGCTSYEPETPK